MNSAHSKGFETRDLRANDDILVYVKNSNTFGVVLEVKAGPSLLPEARHKRQVAVGLWEELPRRLGSRILISENGRLTGSLSSPDNLSEEALDALL